jgi:hypothetical protein
LNQAEVVVVYFSSRPYTINLEFKITMVILNKKQQNKHTL